MSNSTSPTGAKKHIGRPGLLGVGTTSKWVLRKLILSPLQQKVPIDIPTYVVGVNREDYNHEVSDIVRLVLLHSNIFLPSAL